MLASSQSKVISNPRMSEKRRTTKQHTTKQHGQNSTASKQHCVKTEWCQNSTVSKQHNYKTTRDKIARDKTVQPQNGAAKNGHATIQQNVQTAPACRGHLVLSATMKCSTCPSKPQGPDGLSPLPSCDAPKINHVFNQSVKRVRPY